MDASLLAEFKRLCEEANDVALTRDEYFELIYKAAVNLHNGVWTVPEQEE